MKRSLEGGGSEEEDDIDISNALFGTREPVEKGSLDKILTVKDDEIDEDLAILNDQINSNKKQGALGNIKSKAAKNSRFQTMGKRFGLA